MRLPENHAQIDQLHGRLTKINLAIHLLEAVGGENADISYFRTSQQRFQDLLDSQCKDNEAKDYLMWLKLKT